MNKVVRNQQACVNSNPNIQHITQFIQFQHNENDNIEKIKHLTQGTEFQEIACCGDCAMTPSDVLPRWDITIYKKLKNKNVVSKDFECESAENKILFVSSSQCIIGFCPNNISDYMKKSIKHVTVYDSVKTINKFILDSYNGRFDSKVCQFDCGTMAKKLKALNNLDVVTK